MDLATEEKKEKEKPYECDICKKRIDAIGVANLVPRVCPLGATSVENFLRSQIGMLSGPDAV